MNHAPPASATLPGDARSLRFHHRMARRALLSRLESLREGEILLQDGSGERRFGRATDRFPLHGTVQVRNPRFYMEVLLGGALGAAESYMAGDWLADDLTTVLRVLARNGGAATALERGLASLRRPLLRLAHRARRNTRRGSRRNIAAHYDLGNDFFRLFLDREMMYSCAYFDEDTTDLDTASRRKLELICRKLGLGPRHRVLEIGTGWGGFALHAARHHGCRVTTTTISREQAAHARQRVAEAGLEDHIQVLERDYRSLPEALQGDAGRFDRLVSIEMIEAVGHENLDTFFTTCSRLLADDGRMLLQAILIRDQDYEAYRRSVDFIRRYIFPGGHLPCLSALTASVARSTDMRTTHLQDLTPHYARTLRHWRERFEERADKVRALGFDETFLRMWTWYFCSCEAGFRERTVADVQLLLSKPADRTRPLAPEMTAEEARPFAPSPPGAGRTA